MAIEGRAFRGECQECFVRAECGGGTNQDPRAGSLARIRDWQAEREGRQVTPVDCKSAGCAVSPVLLVSRRSITSRYSLSFFLSYDVVGCLGIFGSIEREPT